MQRRDSLLDAARKNSSGRSVDSRTWIVRSCTGALLAFALACSASAEAPGRPSASNGGSAGTGGDGTSGGASAGGASAGGATSGGSGGSSSGVGGASGTPGSGGSANAGGSTGTGGGSNVSFTWLETAPGTGQCKAGRYIGDFNGTFSPSLTIFPLPIPVAGTVDLTLTESQSGEFLDISDGHVTGTANGTYPYEADVMGRLNCITRKLENGFMRNGFYTVGTTNYPFEGPVTADYDTLTYAFVNGTWIAKETNPTYGGNGTWNAKSCPNGPPC